MPILKRNYEMSHDKRFNIKRSNFHGEFSRISGMTLIKNSNKTT
jgi:hypothetical protein